MKKKINEIGLISCLDFLHVINSPKTSFQKWGYHRNQFVNRRNHIDRAFSTVWNFDWKIIGKQIELENRLSNNGCSTFSLIWFSMPVVLKSPITWADQAKFPIFFLLFSIKILWSKVLTLKSSVSGTKVETLADFPICNNCGMGQPRSPRSRLSDSKGQIGRDSNSLRSPLAFSPFLASRAVFQPFELSKRFVFAVKPVVSVHSHRSS